MNLDSLTRVRPDFFIVGAQKAGTTSLFRYLLRHPGVMRPWKKELNFFTDRYEYGLDWYWSRFPTYWQRFRHQRRARGPVLVGEATPFYLFHPHAAQRIHAARPRARIIIMLRDPVARAYSHHAYHIKLGVETLSFEDAIKAEPERLAGELERLEQDPAYPARNYKLYSYLARGCYADQIERWLRYFPADQIHIVRSEDFFTDPEPCYLGVQAFLGLREHRLPDYRTFNPGSETAGLAPATETRLRACFASCNARLETLLQRSMDWDRPA